jgi:ferredoxin
VGVPFNETVDHDLTQTAAKVAAVCPTGALSTYKNKQDHET